MSEDYEDDPEYQKAVANQKRVEENAMTEEEVLWLIQAMIFVLRKNPKASYVELQNQIKEISLPRCLPDWAQQHISQIYERFKEFLQDSEKSLEKLGIANAAEFKAGLLREH